jgi:hypothetical protein
MKDQINCFGPDLLASVMRSLPARVPSRDLRKPKSTTIEAYLLPQHMQHNRAEIQAGELCACISCEQMFPASEIREWVAGGNTAVCPRCDTVALVGSGTGFPITAELLHRAHLLLLRE